MTRRKHLLCVSLLFGVLVFVSNVIVNSEDTRPEVLCQLNLNNNFCDRFTCMGLQPKDCPENTVYEHKLTMCGCCSGCAKYLREGESCNPDDHTRTSIQTENCSGSICPIEINKCMPGLKCPSLGPSEYKCSLPYDDELAGIDKTTCEFKKMLASLDSNWRKLHWTPSCEQDGSYSPKQCKGNPHHGTCYCVNREGGRIFGQAWWAESGNQTCACSRQVYNLRNNGNIATIHCSSDGNYEPLQCDTDSALCYCVEPKTGQVTGAVVPEQHWKSLPCYSINATNWDREGNYLRRCESEWATNKKLFIEAKLHGLTLTGPIQVCDYDGSFSPVQFGANVYFCSYKNGQMVEAYKIEKGDKPMDCHCARDAILYQQEGRTFTRTCNNQTGNYAEVSVVEEKVGLVSCVDADGFYIGQQVAARYQCCLLHHPNETVRCPGAPVHIQLECQKIRKCVDYIT